MSASSAHASAVARGLVARPRAGSSARRGAPGPTSRRRPRGGPGGASTGCRRARPGRARRGALGSPRRSARRWARARFRTQLSSATRRGPEAAASCAIRRGSEAKPRLPVSAVASRSRRAGSRTPKTVRMITSSVIACMVGHGAHRLARRPALDLARRHVGHRLLVAPHPLAVEGRQHQLALRHVGVVVEQQHGVAAEHRQQHHVRLAGMKQPRVAGEHLLHRVGWLRKTQVPSCVIRSVNMSP